VENTQAPKKRMKHPDRVSLTPEALARLSEWVNELKTNLKGSRVTKSDLVDFLVLSHSAQLSEREIEKLKTDHFDEVRFAEWALRQVKAAKASGQQLSLQDVVASGFAVGKWGEPVYSNAKRAK